MQKTLSPTFKKYFTLYSTDTYWNKDHSLSNYETLTMTDLVDDIFETARQLKLEEFVLLSHSCFGIVAIEAAKRQNIQLKGVIAIGSPAYWDSENTQLLEKHFEEQASVDRKNNHRDREAHFNYLEANCSADLLAALEAGSAKQWHDYTISSQILADLWQGAEPDDAIITYFLDTMLSKFSKQLANNIDKISVPVIVIGGESDFDCNPLQAWTNFPTPPNFTLISCENAAHWPHYENPQQFDSQIIAWIEKNQL